jgi:hypothetical protein
MDRRDFIHTMAGGSIGLLVPIRASANLLTAGHDVSLKCLGNVNGPRFLDGRTHDGTVGLAPTLSPKFSGTKWHVSAGGGNILLKCLGVVEGPRWLDGRTANGTVGLARGTARPFTGTRWRVMQVDGNNPDIVALECMGEMQGPRWLDGRTGNGTVGLAANRNPPFTGTRWEIRLYPVTIDQGSEGHPATN